MFTEPFFSISILTTNLSKIYNVIMFVFMKDIIELIQRTNKGKLQNNRAVKHDLRNVSNDSKLIINFIPV